MSVRQWDLDPLPRAEAGRPAPVICVSLGAEGNSATETGEAAEDSPRGRSQQLREASRAGSWVPAASGSLPGRSWNLRLEEVAGVSGGIRLCGRKPGTRGCQAFT